MRKRSYMDSILWRGKLRVTPEKRRAEMEEAADQVWPEEGEQKEEEEKEEEEKEEEEEVAGSKGK